MNLPRLMLFIAALSFCLLADPGLAQGPSPVPDSRISDGPYVLWRNDTTATVIYLCQDKMETFDLTARDTIRFGGFCHDSTTVYRVPIEPPTVQPFVFDSVSRIMAISDIHGEYEALVEICKNSGLTDEKLRWRWGDGHLVVNGDVFDRGDHVTEALWFIYSLEQQALQSGGRVHLVLGNHELMVLQGDNRYINEKYLKGVARKTRIKHEDLYGPDMELGRWLRTRNVVVRLNNILFVHGGLSPKIVEHGYSMEQLSRKVRDYVDIRSCFRKLDDEPRLLFGNFGPLWFRGEVVEYSYPRVTDQQLTGILNFYNATAMVVGHTEMDEVMSHYDQRVFSIDIPVEEKKGLEALLWEDGNFYRITTAGEKVPF